MTKIEALAKFLEVEVSEIEILPYDENAFQHGNAEYLVLDDNEADERAKGYIADSVWAFNANFIIKHSSILDFDDASEKIVHTIAEQCEYGNDAMKKLIDDFDVFVEDAVSADGRGHFISSYDGAEHEQDGYFIYKV